RLPRIVTDADAEADDQGAWAAPPRAPACAPERISPCSSSSCLSSPSSSSPVAIPTGVPTAPGATRLSSSLSSLPSFSGRSATCVRALLGCYAMPRSTLRDPVADLIVSPERARAISRLLRKGSITPMEANDLRASDAPLPDEGPLAADRVWDAPVAPLALPSRTAAGQAPSGHRPRRRQSPDTVAKRMAPIKAKRAAQTTSQAAVP